MSQIQHFYRYYRMGRKRSRAGIDAQLDVLGIRRIRTPTQLGQTSERFMCRACQKSWSRVHKPEEHNCSTRAALPPAAPSQADGNPNPAGDDVAAAGDDDGRRWWPTWTTQKQQICTMCSPASTLLQPAPRIGIPPLTHPHSMRVHPPPPTPYQVSLVLWSCADHSHLHPCRRQQQALLMMAFRHAKDRPKKLRE